MFIGGSCLRQGQELGIRLFKEPKLETPDLIASWPGIGNVGIIAVDTLRGQVRALEMGEIEPWEFFYPTKAIIRSGILTELEFPSSRFYYKRLGERDLIFFIGEEQPTGAGRTYAEGKKAYEMASLVLDTAERFGCRRVYTSGAAVALTHHSLKPRVWAVTSGPDLNKKVRSYENVILMNEVETIGERGSITGLNGLLLGLAKHRGLEAICLMGETPDYLSGAPFPYPKASKSVLEVLTGMLGIEIDYEGLNRMEAQVDSVIKGIYDKLPPDIRERIEQRKSLMQARTETITEDDVKWVKEHIDELFKGGKSDERPS